MASRLNVWPEAPSRSDGRLVLSARLEGGSGLPDRLWYDMPEHYGPWLTPRADPWLLSLLFAAMQQPCDLTIHGRVSRSLLANLERFQEIWCRWLPAHYQAVALEAASEEEESAPDGAAVMAFTGGIDSCFTAFRQARMPAGRRALDIRAGLNVMGFDVPLCDRAQFAAVWARTDRLLGSLGIEPLYVVTNLRELPGNWAYTHGAGIAAALCWLAGRFRAGVIAGTAPLSMLQWPVGSHALTDPLLGSRGFPIVHDGVEFHREEKARVVAQWPQAMEELRVCWVSQQRDRNCGKCYKCIRTKLGFMANGLPLPATLNPAPSLDEIRAWRVDQEWQRADLRHLIECARRSGLGHETWVRTLAALCRRRERRARLRGLARRILPDRTLVREMPP